MGDLLSKMKLKDLFEKYKIPLIFIGICILILFIFMFTPLIQLQTNEAIEGFTTEDDSELNFLTNAPYGEDETESSEYRSTGSAVFPSYDESVYIPQEDQEKKIKRTATLLLEAETEAYMNAKIQIEYVLEQYQGYYTTKNEKKNTYGDKEYKIYTILLHVPQDSFDVAVEDLLKIAEVKSVSLAADDKTKQYYDTAAYLANYKEERERLMVLYERAETIDELIKIEERLTELQSYIDSYQSQLNILEAETTYATISITLSEKKGVIENYYEFTGIKEHWKNMMQSVNYVFVFISKTIVWIIFGVLLLWGYKSFRRLMPQKIKK